MSATANKLGLGVSIVAMLLAACDAPVPTQVVVFFHTSPELRMQADRIGVRVDSTEGDPVYDETHPLTDGPGALARVPLVPKGGDASRVFRIRGTLLDAEGEPLVRAESTAGYTPARLRELHLWLDPECVGTDDCGEGRTCSRGICVGACHEPAPPGELGRSEAVCSECERCVQARCEPLPDGTDCGCPGTDACESGSCVTSTPVAEVSGGHLHTCAAVRGGDVYCWGSNRVGQLGTGGSASSTPTALGLSGIKTGTAATDHTCWIHHLGERKCWGWNGNGQLGLGTVETRRYETPTDAPEDDPAWGAIQAGRFHNCGLTRERQLYCWGSNEYGQSAVTRDDTAPVPMPTRVGDAADWEALAVGGFHSCAVKADGTLWCWGLNSSGELGTGDSEDRSEPVQVGCSEGSCMEDWIAAASGDFHTCGIREGGRLWCWGGGLNGQLGVGPVMERDSSRPLRVEAGRWSAIAAGRAHSCGIRRDGTLWCWGRNDNGELGLGHLERRAAPIQVHVPGTESWVRLGLGRGHSCAIRSDESLWCWGWNEDGQLGLGSSESDAPPRLPTPRRVCFPPD